MMGGTFYWYLLHAFLAILQLQLETIGGYVWKSTGITPFIVHVMHILVSNGVVFLGIPKDDYSVCICMGGINIFC